MIEKCAVCNQKIEILPEQEPNQSATTVPIDYTLTTTLTNGITYPPTTKTYKCSNPKCWVTKITENWQ